jgi:A/G-specific adenine glycosylase
MADPASLREGFFAPAQVGEFRHTLLTWFDQHKRDLPWRRTRDPYAIWVSEIMLQQTRVAAVLEHFANWMARFPTVDALAAAREGDVLAAWSGLGYYRRARFLHHGAKTVVAELGGRLPETAAELRKLPGIGAYTSAAIASIAFDEAAAVVDGNVERVLLRQTGYGENGARNVQTNGNVLKASQMQALASKLVDPVRPGDFNQAMMELGATVCLQKNPSCLYCPVRESCRTVGEHPIATRKSTVHAEVCYGLFRRRRKGVAQVFLEQRRPDATVMPGMWELPCLQPDHVGADESRFFTLRHAIMQTNYRVSVFAMVGRFGRKGSTRKRDGCWIEEAELPSLPLTGLARKIFRRLGLL